MVNGNTCLVVCLGFFIGIVMFWVPFLVVFTEETRIQNDLKPFIPSVYVEAADNATKIFDCSGDTTRQVMNFVGGHNGFYKGQLVKDNNITAVKVLGAFAADRLCSKVWKHSAVYDVYVYECEYTDELKDYTYHNNVVMGCNAYDRTYGVLIWGSVFGLIPVVIIIIGIGRLIGFAVSVNKQNMQKNEGINCSTSLEVLPKKIMD